MEQLNIKNADAYRLAREISSLTGEKMTQAVIVALRDRLERIRAAQRAEKAARLDDVLALADRCARLPEQDARAPDVILYDADGLPRDAGR